MPLGRLVCYSQFLRGVGGAPGREGLRREIAGLVWRQGARGKCKHDPLWC